MFVEEGSLSIGTITTICFEKEAQFFINFCSTFHCGVLSHGEVTNNYNELLDAQTTPIYVRYHKSSKKKIKLRKFQVY